jgi:hypothetical protein
MCGVYIAPFIVHGQSCDNPQSPEPVRIYFVNGMNNAFLSAKIENGQLIEQDMIASKEALRRLVGDNVASFGNSFNFQEDGYTQAKQVAQQRLAQPVQFWQWMAQMQANDPFGVVPQSMREADSSTKCAALD